MTFLSIELGYFVITHLKLSTNYKNTRFEERQTLTTVGLTELSMFITDSYISRYRFYMVLVYWVCLGMSIPCVVYQCALCGEIYYLCVS